MNREHRRSLQKAANRAVEGDGDVVRLEGGPMDGYLVKPDAPALSPDWGEHAGYLGRYERAGEDDLGTPIARWIKAPA